MIRESQLEGVMADRVQEILPVYAVTPFTMLDYPGKAACIVWLAGCNMRCAYCHNPQIVRSKGRNEIGKVLAFLERRRGLLDGVVLSGGEATLYPGLLSFAEHVKAMGFAVKLDTNGTRPAAIRSLLAAGVLDFVALDFKAPVKKFQAITGLQGWCGFSETLDMLLARHGFSCEIRTTIHSDLLDESDVNAIIYDLDVRGYDGVYYLQNFKADNERPTLGALRPQSRLFDISSIATPKNFRLAFRNF